MSSKEDQKAVLLEKEKDKRTITVPDEDVHQLPFTAIPNEIIDDPNISPTGKLLMVYLLKHAGIPGWQYNDSAMYKFLHCGRDKLEAAFKSLRQAGYVTTIIKYDEKGRVCGSKRIFARTPKYLELNKSRLKIVPKATDNGDSLEALKIRESIIDKGPENQGTGDQGTLNQGLLQIKTIKNKNIKKQQTSPASTKLNPEPQNLLQEPDPAVVALIENVKQWAIANTLVKTWLKKHSAEYILERIEYTKVHAKTNPAGFLRKAVENNYRKYPALANEPKAEQKPPVEQIWPSHEANLTWYAGLLEEEKQKCFEQAKHKHPHFEEMLKIEKVNFKSMVFLKTTWFKMMMQLVGRAK